MNKEQAEREAARERVRTEFRSVSIAMNALGIASLVLLGAVNSGKIHLPRAVAVAPLGLVLFAYGIIDVKTGVANAFSRGRVVLKSQEPRLYWFETIAMFVLSATAFAFAFLRIPFPK